MMAADEAAVKGYCADRTEPGGLDAREWQNAGERAV
jgi:hypothetical protein